MQNNTQRLLKQFGKGLWLTDAGLETAMIFLEGIDLPQFAAFTLLDSAEGQEALLRYNTSFLNEAKTLDAGFLLDTVTWRASAGWGQVLGLTPAEIDQVNRTAVAQAKRLQTDRSGNGQQILINGVIGPHGDAYAPDQMLSAEDAENYHRRQVGVLAASGVDLITAMTLSSHDEAIGIARAAQAVNQPVALSFTVETDGLLISGMTLQEAIYRTDEATNGTPIWYGINCAHPDHFRHVLSGDWVHRIGSVRANASRLSHAELDEALQLDDGNIDELAQDYKKLLHLLPGLRVVGGCCGTDLRHLAAIGQSCLHLH